MQRIIECLLSGIFSYFDFSRGLTPPALSTLRGISLHAHSAYAKSLLNERIQTKLPAIEKKQSYTIIVLVEKNPMRPIEKWPLCGNEKQHTDNRQFFIRQTALEFWGSWGLIVYPLLKQNCIDARNTEKKHSKIKTVKVGAMG